MNDFQQVQQQFIAHIKDPVNQPALSDIEDRRLAIYRDLFFNNILGFVSSSFPVLKSLYDETAWCQMVRDFFICHDCHSPYFVDISKEFVDYLMHQYQPSEQDYPFLIELAHYEWIELDVSIRHASCEQPWLNLESLEQSQMVLSQLAWPLSYSFAVHQISTDHIPSQPIEGGVHLVVYRDNDDDVQFMQINGVTAMLLQLLADNPGVKLDTLVHSLVNALAQFTAQQVADGAIDVIHHLVAKGIIRRYQTAQ